MDRRERFGNLSLLLETAIDSKFKSAWTALPAIIQKYDPERMTVEAQPCIKAFLTQPGQEEQEVEMPLLVDVPVVFPGGGDFLITCPLREGDEVLIVFSNRCIDSWWQSGGIQSQAERRFYDLADGICIPTVKSQATVLPEVSAENIEIRNLDGSCKILIKPDKTIRVENDKFDFEVTNEGNITINNAGNVNISNQGDITLQNAGNVTAEVQGVTKVQCQTVELGTQAMEKMIRGETFMQFFNNHVHLGNLGAPTSIPQIPMTALQLSAENIKNS